MLFKKKYYLLFFPLLVLTAFVRLQGPSTAALITDNGPVAADVFVNFETPHVHPLAITPNGRYLLAVNTPDNRLEVFRIRGRKLRPAGSIPVGMDPVTVRVLNDREAWVVNHLSDNISIVDLDRQVVVRTLQTENEPSDVVFAGSPRRAIVSCSEANRINVFELADPESPPLSVLLNGEEPRALSVSPDGQTVYAAFFESGNQTTIVPGGKDESKQLGRMKDAVRHPGGPYGGRRVPPNDGDNFRPKLRPEIDFDSDHPPPTVSMIVRKDKQGRWMDDNQGDWTRLISGDLAAASRRVPGWDLPDRDVAIIDANSLKVSYQTSLMNMLMAMEVHPKSGEVNVVGTDATNEIRYEPNLQGRFLRVNWASFSREGQKLIRDMNPHLDYREARIPPEQRKLSIADPRGIAWNQAGTRSYITGMGTNNLIVLDASGKRLVKQPIPVGEGPTGIVLHERSDQAFVLNKFSASISIIDLKKEREVEQVPFYDPTPAIIKQGRPHLYFATVNSGLGHISCASCHVDARSDRLVWDLGNPQGKVMVPDSLPPFFSKARLFKGFHPMKGPLRTQILQDITRHPALHWQGDKKDIFEFAEAYRDLQGADAPKTHEEMEAFEAFLSTIHFPPNPYRKLDNSFADSIPIKGPNNERLGYGVPERAIKFFSSMESCLQCHPGNTGRMNLLVENFLHIDIYQQPENFRGFYERNGFYSNTVDGSNAGFGKLPDGSEFFDLGDGRLSDKEKKDIEALLMSFDGGVPWAAEEVDPSLDAHAAIGQQLTVNGVPGADDRARLDQLTDLAEKGAIGWIAKGIYKREHRGFTYLGKGLYQSDRTAEVVDENTLIQSGIEGNPVTFMAVPRATRFRTGVDRDGDGIFDADEHPVLPAERLHASITISSGGAYELYFNGDLIGKNTIWQTAEVYHRLRVKPGKNVIAVKAESQRQMAGLIAEFKLMGKRLGTNEEWKVSKHEIPDWESINFGDRDWASATLHYAFGEGPWSNKMINFAYDTPAGWIWAADREAEGTLYARFSFMMPEEHINTH